MRPAEQRYEDACFAVQPLIDRLQRRADDMSSPQASREMAGQRALALRADLYRLRVEAANG